MELRLPNLVTSTALFNIYLVLSICWINVYAADKPVARVAYQRENEEEGVLPMTSNLQWRSVDSVNDNGNENYLAGETSQNEITINTTPPSMYTYWVKF